MEDEGDLVLATGMFSFKAQSTGVAGMDAALVENLLSGSIVWTPFGSNLST